MPNKKTFPVTVTCAGNRRKEQNMTKQTVRSLSSSSLFSSLELRDTQVYEP